MDSDDEEEMELAAEELRLRVSREKLLLSICGTCKAITMRGDIDEHLNWHTTTGTIRRGE